MEEKILLAGALICSLGTVLLTIDYIKDNDLAKFTATMLIGAVASFCWAIYITS